MNIRKPMVAGQFYPNNKAEISSALSEILSNNFVNKKSGQKDTEKTSNILGGIVPHAGWVCSGAVAGQVFNAIKQNRDVDTFVIFGAVHHLVHYGSMQASMFCSGSWQTPLGNIEIDQDLAKLILLTTDLIADDPEAHAHEHSIEVQIPIIQYLFPEAKILPISMPPISIAPGVGKIVARAIEESKVNTAIIASSDLTHYGPGYNFTPAGSNLDGIRWSKDVNDKGLIDIILKMDAQQILAYAAQNAAACGAGAIAAAVEAAKTLNANTANLLSHTNSYEVILERFSQRSADAVGYASITFETNEP